MEDDDDFGQVVIEHLVRLGHDVRRASNAPQALALVDSFSPDVVLIDIRLPIFDGNGIASAIRAHWKPRPRLIAFTAVIETVDTILFDAWLAKPTTVGAVSQALTESFLRSGTSTVPGAWRDDVDDTKH